MRVKHWQDWVILAAAVWLYISPFVLGFGRLSHPAAALAWVCAVALTISASEALVMPDPIEQWADMIAALALMAGPWLFGFRAEIGAAANSVIVGAFVAVIATAALLRDRRQHLAAHPGLPKGDNAA
jgi:hypothetical protein